MAFARIAISIGYIGRGFSGSQYQPKLNTVQGVIEDILYQLDWSNGNEDGHAMTMSSRTDAGVSALANIGSFDLERSIWLSAGPDGVTKAINDLMPDNCVVTKAVEIGSDSNITDPKSRTYLYRLQALEGWPAGVSVELMSEWCTMFEGTHDFRNFCRLVEGRPTLRTLISCRPWLDATGVILGFRVTGVSFVWNQVRRIAAAIQGIAAGKITQAQVKAALENPDQPADFGLAPADWLVLWSVTHSEIPESREVESPSIHVGTEATPRGRAYKLWSARIRREQEAMLLAEWLDSVIQ
jgi:tRNA pseudouridine38-40 synthase